MTKIHGEELDIDRKDRVYLPYLGRNYRPVRERIFDFREAIESFDIQHAQFEASRCIHCPEPEACVEACPLHNDIPSALWYIENGDIADGQLAATSIHRYLTSIH